MRVTKSAMANDVERAPKQFLWQEFLLQMFVAVRVSVYQVRVDFKPERSFRVVGTVNQVEACMNPNRALPISLCATGERFPTGRSPTMPLIDQNEQIAG